MLGPNGIWFSMVWKRGEYTMKKKSVLLMCTVLSLALTACGGTEKEAIGHVNQSEDVVVSEEQANVVDTEETEAGSASNQEETVLPDDMLVSEMLTSFMNWTGLQYFYDEPVAIDGLTAVQAIPMAAHATGFFHNDLEITPEGQIVLPQNLLEETMTDLFGQSYNVADIAGADLTNSMISVSEEGTVMLNVGDWGMSAPKFEIESISAAENADEVLVVAQYGSIDYENQEEKLMGYKVTYRLAKSEGTKYGYVIVDMKVELS